MNRRIIGLTIWATLVALWALGIATGWMLANNYQFDTKRPYGDDRPRLRRSPTIAPV